MIPRYTHKEMGAVWSETRRYGAWLEVELAATDALAAAGIVPDADARTLRERAGFDAKCSVSDACTTVISETRLRSFSKLPRCR